MTARADIRSAAHEVLAAPPLRRAWFRWVVCGLLFFATANNYMDRQVFGIMGPELLKIFGWKPEVLAEIAFWFQLAYGAGFLLSGPILDRIGTRLGFAVAVTCWSLAAAAHGLMGSVLGFKLVRAALGLSEPAHLPAAIKAVAEWFPRQERALACGIYKAGSNLGAVIVPIAIPWLFVTFGWRDTFLLTASTGFLWLGFWLWLYRSPSESRHVGAEERAFILAHAEPPAPPRVPWGPILRRRETWAYMLAKFLTDSMWHWYAAMFPLFLSQNFKLSIREFGLPLIVLYLIADVGSIGGGWLSSHWIKRGWDLTRARKAAMLICCACTVPVVLVTQVQNLWVVVVLVGLAHAAHQGWTSNLFTTVSDMFPRNAVGTVVGLGGAAGQAGAAVMSMLSIYFLRKDGNLTALFAAAGSTYLVAWLVYHLQVRRFEPIILESSA